MNPSRVSFILAFLCFPITVTAGRNEDPTQFRGDVSINCRSRKHSAASNGRKWHGDIQPKASSSLQFKGFSRVSTFADPVPHKKGRASSSQFSCTFQVNAGQEIFRLYFKIFKLKSLDNSHAKPSPVPPERALASRTIHKYGNAAATLAVTILSMINIMVYKMRKMYEASITEEENIPSARAQRFCRRFSLAEVKSATKNFSEALVIGRGGFGKVYKGLVDNGEETVAIKRLKSNSKQGIETQI